MFMRCHTYALATARVRFTTTIAAKKSYRRTRMNEHTAYAHRLPAPYDGTRWTYRPNLNGKPEREKFSFHFSTTRLRFNTSESRTILQTTVVCGRRSRKPVKRCVVRGVHFPTHNRCALTRIKEKKVNKITTTKEIHWEKYFFFRFIHEKRERKTSNENRVVRCSEEKW